METQLYGSYQPLKWPPDLALAKLHMKCSCPGKDNIDGIQCPCCGRYQKLKTRNWYARDIIKDFKCYGGGIPTYFQLIKYCIATLITLALIINFFHIYVLESVCPLLLENQIENRCQTFLVIFKLCDPTIIYETLISQQRFTQAYAFFYLQLSSFVYLCIATVGMKWWIQRVNIHKVVKQQKIYSHFALMIKNIPRFYKTQDIKRQMHEIVPEAEIVDLFFVYEIAELEDKFKKLFDLGFEIEYLKQSISQGRGQSQATLQQSLQQFIQLYDQMQVLKKKIGVANGRAIIVFNNKKHRNIVRKTLKITQCNKLIFHTFKFLGMNTQKMSLIADKIPQPQQILWKYVGESSATKTKVRIETTGISLGFMLLCFALLYFPMIKIDQTNVRNKSVLSTVLGLLISTVLQILAIVYRQIIIRLIPRRHPSSRQAQSYFIVMTTVVFHFMFYIVAPVSYFVLTDIAKNYKLKQLFIAVMTFLVMTLLVAIIDLRYRLSNARRNKLLSAWAFWGKYCQMRLHEQLKWPSFPIQFKLMVILNIWTFNAFYIFQIPYLLILFVIVLFILYWLDKKNIYRHYKMQVYLSIDLQLSVQRDYIVLFLICVCSGYAICAIYYWQYIVSIVMFVLSLLLNFIISYEAKYSEKLKQKGRSQTLNEVIKTHSVNVKASMRQNLLQMQLRQNYMMMDQKSTISLGSASFTYGYRQLYDNYVNHFRNKSISQFLYKNYRHNKRRLTNLSVLLENRQPIDQSASQHTDRSKIRESIMKNNQFMLRQSYIGFAAQNNNIIKQQVETQVRQRGQTQLRPMTRQGQAQGQGSIS